MKRLHDCPLLSVDTVCRWRGGIVLIERKNPPLGLALPGGMVDIGETAEHAAVRELKEETNLLGLIKGFVGVYSEPNRDPRDHIVTLAYAVEAHDNNEMKALDDAKEVHLLEPGDALAQDLIADHNQILTDAINSIFDRRIYS